MMHPFFTIGHSMLSVSEFVDLLRGSSLMSVKCRARNTNYALRTYMLARASTIAGGPRRCGRAGFVVAADAVDGDTVNILQRDEETVAAFAGCERTLLAFPNVIRSGFA